MKSWLEKFSGFRTTWWSKIVSSFWWILWSRTRKTWATKASQNQAMMNLKGQSVWQEENPQRQEKMVVCVFAKIKQKKFDNFLGPTWKLAIFVQNTDIIRKIQVGYFASDNFFSSFFIWSWGQNTFLSHVLVSVFGESNFGLLTV